MLQLTFVTEDKNADLIEQTLLGCGALSITFQDAADSPVLEPSPGENPLWSTIKISALFNCTRDMDEIHSCLSNLSVLRTTSLVIDILKDQDWVREGMRDFKAMRFGQQLWICPSWHPICHQDAIAISLDPGLAFGTGAHPTTALCLRWLDSHPPKNATVVDYGCGSGILAIVAVKLGAQHAWAVDIDSQAIWATRENMEKNRISKEIIETVKPDCLPDIQADILIANILSGPLIELSSNLVKLVKPNGQIILSGILVEQAESVASKYAKYCTMGPSQTQEGWVLLEGQRK
jgi:ribosomal protein L11 methyltransferase